MLGAAYDTRDFCLRVFANPPPSPIENAIREVAMVMCVVVQGDILSRLGSIGKFPSIQHDFND